MKTHGVFSMRCALVLLSLCMLPASSHALKPTDQGKVVRRARLEVTRGVTYDPAYKTIPYPNGDINTKHGVCTDVVIRAFRTIGMDLQQLIRVDRKQVPSAYGGGRPDPNIDHRRCKTQIVYMKRHAKTLTKDVSKLAEWQPGDLVYWDLDGKGLMHVGVISDRKNNRGRPLVIHNIGPVASENDVLAGWKIIGHYRL